MNSPVRTIFKLQRPLAGSDLSLILYYNQDRSIMAQQAMSSKDIRKIFGDTYKTYQYAHVNKENGALVIEGAAPKQEW